MKILKNILKTKEKIEDNLKIQLKDETICIANLNILEKYDIEEPLDPIFEMSELYKNLKKIAAREEAILFLKERKKIDYKEYTEIFINRTIATLNKQKYTKKDIGFLINQFEISNLSIPNFKKIRGRNKKNIARVLKEKLELERNETVEKSFKYNLQLWELIHQ